MKNLNRNSIVAVFVAFLALGLIGPIAAFAAGPTPVDLLSAGNFTILSETGITNIHSSAITGNIGSSPITAAAMNDVWCSEITGTIYGVDAAYVGNGITTTCFAGNPGVPPVVPSDANKTLVDKAVLDMGTAYTDAAGRSASAGNTNLYGGNLGGQTFMPGLYKWTTDVTIPTDVTLSGGANDVWIFQIAGNLNIASGGSVPTGIKVILAGGAQASNVFWQVGGAGATLGTYSTFNGNILSATLIAMQTGAVLNGRALAQTQVTLDANKVSVPVVSIPTIGALTVYKHVVNTGGGQKTADQFTINVTGGNPDSAVFNGNENGTPITLDLDAQYAVSETPDSTYASSMGNDGCQGTLTAENPTATCTITNTYVPPQPTTGNIIVKKVTSNGDTTTSFTFITSGSGYGGFNLTGGGQKDSGSLNANAGAYSVAESNLPTNWSSDGGKCVSSVTGKAQASAAISLAAGETVTCTFTNTYTAPPATGSIKVIKTAVNGKGTFKFTGNNGIAGFSITTACGGTGSYTIKNLVAGTYAITEDTASLPAGWAKTSDTCGSVVVAAGIATCAVTNTYIAPPLPIGTIKIVKTTVGGNSAMNTFSFVVANSNGKTIGTPSISLSGSSSNSVALSVAAGRYTIQEKNSCGNWKLTSLVCDNVTVAGNKASITVGDKQTVTCAFTNTIAKANQTITVKKYAPTTEAKGSSFTVSAIAGSGLPVAITVSGNCSIAGGGSGTATVKMGGGAGICATHYNQAGNSAYNAAPEVVENTAVAKTCHR